MGKEILYKDLIAFHPGAYVEEIIDDLNITQDEFAERLETSPKTISKIVNGEERISNDIALKLAKVTGVSTKTWLNLQSNYDVKVMEIQDLQAEDEKEVVDLIDFKYFKTHSFIEDKTYKKSEKLAFLRNFLNMSNISKLYNFDDAVSYRSTQDFSEKSIVNSNVMLEIAINEARNKTDNKYNKKNLEKILPKIKKMSLEEPKQFYPRLEKILLDCGIVLVGLPILARANLNGATKKFKNGSVLLLITDRNKKSDIFWFSLMHEIGHIYNNDFYSDYEDIEKYREEEKIADEFSKNFFVPLDKYNLFIENGDYSESAVLKFSADLEICSSILVGRLQKDKHIDYSNLSHLRKTYNIIVNKKND